MSAIMLVAMEVPVRNANQESSKITRGNLSAINVRWAGRPTSQAGAHSVMCVSPEDLPPSPAGKSANYAHSVRARVPLQWVTSSLSTPMFCNARKLLHLVCAFVSLS